MAHHVDFVDLSRIKESVWGERSQYDLPLVSPKEYVGEAEAAWLASIIDCEGSIGLSKSRADSPRGYCIVPAIQISNTNIDLIGKIVEILRKLGVKDAVHIGKKEFRNPKWKPAYYIVIQQYHDVLLLIEYLLPFLIAKKPQAQVVLSYCKHRVSINHLGRSNRWRGRFGPSYDGSELRFYEQSRILNRKGQ